MIILLTKSNTKLLPIKHAHGEGRKGWRKIRGRGDICTADCHKKRLPMFIG
uniref:Uncharacterized protein n=1 Tax=Arundo donax TaxID=35708 RepID=A0A0A9HQ90_ARUDO